MVKDLEQHTKQLSPERETISDTDLIRREMTLRKRCFEAKRAENLKSEEPKKKERALPTIRSLQ